MKWFFAEDFEDDPNVDLQTDVFNEKYYLREVRMIKIAIKDELETVIATNGISIETVEKLCYLIDRISFIYIHNNKANYQSLANQLKGYENLVNLRKEFFKIDIYSNDLYNDRFVSKIVVLSQRVLDAEKEIVDDVDEDKELVTG